MSESQSAADTAGVAPDRYDTTTQLYRGHGDASMNAIGWIIFLGAMVLALPLLPFALLAWIANRLL